MARDAEKFGRTSVSENEHPDYGMLKLEAEMRENKDIINWIASNKQSMVNYLEINNNSKGASHCMRYLFKTWSNKEDFVTPTEFYKSATRAGFQTSSKPNLALSTRPSQQAIDIGYLGFSNVLHSFFEGRNDAFANQFKGYIINDMFKVNGLPSSIQFEFLGAIFDFGITNGRTNDVVFVGDNGRTLLNNGFNTNAVIKADNAELVEKLNFISLLKGSTSNSGIFNSQELEFIHKIIDNSIKDEENISDYIEKLREEWPFADCSSFEYATRNGVRIAVVSGLKDSFVTNTSNGIKYSWINYSITNQNLYFRMPVLGITNGRAATITAQVVTATGEAINDWLSLPGNNNVSDLLLELKYFEFLQEGMRAVGGSVSKNNLHGAVENPAPYKVNLINPTNCE